MGSQRNPFLSIIIPNYNYAHFIEAAVRSINSRNYPIEILIIDDASQDNSQEKIIKLAKEFACVRFHFKNKNEGVQEAVSTAVQLATGTFIHPFAADDLYFPHTLDTVFHYLKKFPHISLFSADLVCFEDIRKLETLRALKTARFHFFDPAGVLKLYRHTDFFLPGTSIFVRRAVYQKYLPQNKNLQHVSDWFINHLLALDVGVGYIPAGLVAMRKHPHAYSAALTLEKKRTIWKELLNILEEKKELKPFAHSGVLRMLGLKAIYKDLLLTPRYWKYLPAILQKETEKRLAHLLNIDRDQFWIKQLTRPVDNFP